MKIVIDRKYTEDCKLARTKAQIKEFKEIYTENDLVRMFQGATGETLPFIEEIVYCRMEAFSGGTAETDETHYSVDMMLDTFSAVYKIHFYITQSGEIDTRRLPIYNGEMMQMWQVKKYTAA